VQISGAGCAVRGLAMLLICAALPPPAGAAPAAALGYVPKYRPGFDHYDYVQADAPKGGELVLAARGSFDSLNPFVLKGSPAMGLTQLVFEPLMDQSLDEPYSVYAHLAEDIELAADRLSVTFRLDPRARFSNGKPVTADDVKFSFDTLKSKAAHPQFRIYWTDIQRAVVINPRTVRFDFAHVNPELHLVVATQLPIFSRDWVAGQAFDKLAMERPIGSGPYVVDSLDLGKQIRYTRSPNYWAARHNTRRGMYNFDRITFKYYRDDVVMLEAFKAGEFEFNWEFNSKVWARDYVGPPFTDGRIKRAELHNQNDAGMQGFVFNLRRPLFQDVRVRRALSLAFDFDWSNRHLFYGQYTRCDSYFSNSELAAHGIPQGEELRLLELYRNRLPPTVFSEVWAPPDTRPPHSLRANLRQAKALLADAGWTVRDGRLRNAADQPFEFEVLLISAQKGFDRILAPYAHNLDRLGVHMTYRAVDSALYQRRTDQFDFDVMVASFGASQSPGNELLSRFHSSSAGQEGSDNIMGLKDPVVDALIEKVIYAPDRRRLITAVHALDRVLVHGDYLVPNWYIATHRVAYWDRFGIPATLPLYYNADSWMRMTWWKK
jgi:microcin C transport system substrate-binding protein